MLLAFEKEVDMVSIRRFLKSSAVSQQIHFKSLLFCTLLAGCAGPTGDSPQPADGLACSSALNSEGGSVEEAEQQVESASTEPDINLDPSYDSFIVQFSDNEPSEGLQPSGNPIREYRVAGVTLTQIQGKTYSLDLRQVSSREDVIARLAQERPIRYVEPDYPISQGDNMTEEELDSQDLASELPEDDSLQYHAASRVSEQWHLPKVQASQAWQSTRGASDVVVAVVDSGIDYTHQDLKNNIWTNSAEQLNGRDDDNNGYVDDIRGWNYVNNNNNPKTTSQSNHGTHVAGIIGAAGNVLGVAPRVKLMPLRFIGESGSGLTSSAIRAIDYAVQKRVFAINNSWGSSNKSRALQDAITRAERAGILFVVAAGNGSNGVGYNISTRPYYPAAYTNSNILRVAATRTNDLLTAFSNYGQRLVDVAAPGSSILSTVTGNRYMRMSGTSMATPLVTGLAVLVKAANRGLSAYQVRAIINSSVDVIPGLRTLIRSGGRVNAKKAVAMALGASPNTPLPVPNCLN